MRCKIRLIDKFVEREDNETHEWLMLLWIVVTPPNC